MKILCTIVLYKTKLYDARSYIDCASYALTKEDYKLFVFDNSPFPLHSYEELQGYGIEYISDISNPGLSKAYNTAAKYAKDNGYDWILLLDQDTSFEDNSYLSLCDKLIKCRDEVLLVPKVKRLGGRHLSPMFMKHHFPRTPILVPNNAYSLKNVSIINSGMLVNVDAFHKVGGYNESVPLDLADYQFIERISKKYNDFYLMDYNLLQTFSNDVDNLESLIYRFNSYCVGSLNYEANLMSRCDIIFSMIKRCISLTIRTRRFCFFGIMFKTFFK